MPTKKFKCVSCKEEKPARKFYASPSQKRGASPNCIDCNNDVNALGRYKRQIKSRGVKAFMASMKQKENQLGLMVKALHEVTV